MSDDRELTKQILGDIGPLRFNPKVVKVCHGCGVQNIVHYKGRNKPSADYYCRKCVVNRPEVKDKKRKTAKEQWENNEFRKLVVENSQKIWDDPDRRHKMSAIRRDPDNIARLRKNAKIGGLASIKSQNGKISSIQMTLYSILDDLGVTYEREYCLGPYAFDCRIHGLLLECNGDYWHSLPKNVARDKAKQSFIERYHQSYKLKTIWEHEFKNLDKVQGLLKYWLGLSTPEICDFSFDDVVIANAPAIDYKVLLSK